GLFLAGEVVVATLEFSLSCRSCVMECVASAAPSRGPRSSPPAPPPPAPPVVGPGGGALRPPERLNARLRAIPGTPAVVELYDLGAPFRVVAAGRVREYRDEARDCAYRARVAA